MSKQFIPPPQGDQQLVRTVRTDTGVRTLITCPRCEVEQDVLAYKPLSVMKKYERHLNGIVKCLLCKHAFSPKDFS